MTAAAQSTLLRRSLCPGAALLGSLLAFVSCCVAGRLVARHNQYKWFTRFHYFLEPQTLYYPTASQVVALARARLDRDKVAVIVGGNSVLLGVGQRVGELWTKELQELLGDDYCVLNLAAVGALPAEFGGVVAEILDADYRLIYVSDVGSTTLVGDPDGALYRYFYWDAHFKGLLPPYPERRRRLAQLTTERRQKGDRGFDELQAGRRLDARLFYQDLWTSCAFKKFGTVWTPLLGRNFISPRWLLSDSDDWGGRERLGKPFHEERMALVRHFARSAGSVATGRPLPPVAARAGLRVNAGDSPLVLSLWNRFPPATRRRSLLVVQGDSPEYVDRLPPEARADYRWARAMLAEAVEAAGFTSLELGDDFGKDDFVDYCHLSEAGGRHLARCVAPKVRELARRLGYLREEEKP